LSDEVFIFLSGIIGVFSGMALLYISIRIMGKIADRFETEKKEEKND